MSAAEISQIVQAQVTAGLEGSLTRGDVEDLVAAAVTEAVGDQLSAEDVKAIVDSSLVATNTAIEEAAMAAANAAEAAAGAAMAAEGAAMAAEEAIQGVQQLSQIIPTPEPDTGIVRVPAVVAPPLFRGATEADQTLVFPIQSKRSQIAPNVEGSYIVRTVDKWVFMPLFQFDPDGNLREGRRRQLHGQRRRADVHGVPQGRSRVPRRFLGHGCRCQGGLGVRRVPGEPGELGRLAASPEIRLSG